MKQPRVASDQSPADAEALRPAKSESLEQALVRAESAAAAAARDAEEARELLRIIADCAPALIFVRDAEGRFQFANRAYCERFGLSVGELIGKTPSDLFPADFAQQLRDNDRATMTFREVISFEEHSPPTADGKDHTFLAVKAPIIGADAQLKGVCGVTTDITDLRERDRQLAEATAQLRATLSNMSDGVLMFDSDLNLLVSNERYLQMCRFRNGQVMRGAPLIDILRLHARCGHFGPGEVEDLAQAVLDRTLEADDRRAIEQLCLSEGTTIELRARRLDSGGVVYTLSDITSHKIAQEALKVAAQTAESATKAKSGFLAHMSHELRTPLNAIGNYSRLVLDDLVARGDEALAGDMRKICTANEHLLELVSNILDLARIESGKLSIVAETIDLGDFLQGVATVAEPLRTNRGNRFELHRADAPGVMTTDPLRLRQILLNLLSNAFKFTKQGLVTLTVSVEASEVAFTVADNGIGMTAEQLARVFRPFEQADAETAKRYGGTGLGLALTEQFVLLLGGSIHAESVKNEGSTFIVRLPRFM